MSDPPLKPKGESGAMKIGPEGAYWDVIPFPHNKAEREQLIASLFVGSFDQYVAMESEPSLAPFTELTQNGENDLDFTVQTALGQMLMELAEFAPLAAHGPTFVHAPKSLHPSEKAARSFELIAKKSEHQGGNNRFLVLYVTEHGFWLDPISIEILRRRLINQAPQFERVYYVGVHDLQTASVSEIFPGAPHHMFGEHADDVLEHMNVIIPHPTEMTIGRSIEFTGLVTLNGRAMRLPMTVDFRNVGTLKAK